MVKLVRMSNTCSKKDIFTALRLHIAYHNKFYLLIVYSEIKFDIYYININRFLLKIQLS